jgi:hypothetical protein
MVDTHTAEGFNLKPQEIDRLEQESGEKIFAVEPVEQ